MGKVDGKLSSLSRRNVSTRFPASGVARGHFPFRDLLSGCRKEARTYELETFSYLFGTVLRKY